jgi:hypothetical protein
MRYNSGFEQESVVDEQTVETARPDRKALVRNTFLTMAGSYLFVTSGVNIYAFTPVVLRVGNWIRGFKRAE